MARGLTIPNWGHLGLSRSWGLTAILAAAVISGCGAARSFEKAPKPEGTKPFALAGQPKLDDPDAKARYYGAKKFMENQMRGWPEHDWPAPPDTAAGKRRMMGPLRIRGGGPKGVPKGKLDAGPSKVRGALMHTPASLVSSSRHISPSIPPPAPRQDAFFGRAWLGVGFGGGGDEERVRGGKGGRSTDGGCPPSEEMLKG